MNFKEQILGVNPRFSQLKLIEKRSTCVVVELNGKNYGISMKRISLSDCEDNTELYISKDGKWLIPADTVVGSTTPDW